MKSLIPVLLTALSLTAAANEFRTWTREKSGREIEAKMIDKIDDDSKAQVQLRDGKKYWLVADKLVEADREYIAAWTPAIEHLTVRVVGTRKGGHKTIRVVAKAGLQDVTIVTLAHPGDDDPATRRVEARAEAEFREDVQTKYIVRCLGPDGEVLDEESWDSKTGL